MSLRRYVSLMHGLGYSAVPAIEANPSARRTLSQEGIRALPRGVLRYAPGVSDDE